MFMLLRIDLRVILGQKAQKAKPLPLVCSSGHKMEQLNGANQFITLHLIGRNRGRE